MSDPLPPRSPRPPRNAFLTVLMVLIGLVLLLPGLCSIVMTGILITSGDSMFRDSSFVSLIAFCFAVGVGGVFLIIHAVRG
jgi:hypothetical protein